MTKRRPATRRTRANARATRTATRATRGHAYHHGDLPRAMLEAAVQTIQRHGVDALTLRGVGDELGVSRTALYRHFANKEALLRAVASEGFRMLERELTSAWIAHGQGRPGFEAMGHAYVQFAVRYPSHYRVMFGRVLAAASPSSPGKRAEEGGDAFGALVSALAAQQQAGLVRDDDPQQLALYVWSVVHGVAMLAVDGILPTPAAVAALTAFAVERLRTGIAAPASPGAA